MEVQVESLDLLILHREESKESIITMNLFHLNLHDYGSLINYHFILQYLGIKIDYANKLS